MGNERGRKRGKLEDTGQSSFEVGWGNKFVIKDTPQEPNISPKSEVVPESLDDSTLPEVRQEQLDKALSQKTKNQKKYTNEDRDDVEAEYYNFYKR